MKKKFERHVVLPAVLMIYSLAMAVIAYPNYKEQQRWSEYILIVGIGILLPVVLYFILKRRKKIRDEFTKSN